MQKIGYYFKNDDIKKEKKITKLMQQPIFNELISYFYEKRNQEIILRMIKKDFSYEKIETLLEEMIALQLITRQNKRYFLNFPLFTKQLETSYSSIIEEILQTIALEDLPLFLGEVLWDTLFFDEQNYFYGTFKNMGTFYTKKRIEGEGYSFVSIHKEEQTPLDFPTYFSLLRTDNSLPDSFHPLEQLLGDVDVFYFMKQTKRVLKTIEKNRAQKEKKSIFQDALLTVGVAEVNETGLKIVCPIVNKSEKKEVGVEILASIHTFFDKITETNQRLLMKHLFYRQILEQCYQSSATIVYLVQ